MEDPENAVDQMDPGEPLEPHLQVRQAADDARRLEMVPGAVLEMEVERLDSQPLKLGLGEPVPEVIPLRLRLKVTDRGLEWRGRVFTNTDIKNPEATLQEHLALLMGASSVIVEADDGDTAHVAALWDV